VATWDGTTITLYENASVIGTLPASGSMAAGTNDVAAGVNPAYSGDLVDGLMAWVAVYDTALSGSQITAHYNAASGPTNVTGTFSAAMAPMALAFSGAETISGQARVAMGPMALAFSGTETGANVTGTFSVAMAPMRLRFAQRGPAAGYVPDGDEAREFKRWLLWDL